jgi:hypothetical protein
MKIQLGAEGERDLSNLSDRLDKRERK